ncbi:MAG: CDP-alcohol phosphatidyltransferase family protein [Planctomycetota bacterium]
MKYRNLPNQITMARLVLSVVFFVLLAVSDVRPDPDKGLLLAAFVLYIVAGLTDVLDGYLARKWKVTSAFGRIADPFVDKVIVCGAFALLAGRNFAYPPGGDGVLDQIPAWLPDWLHGGMASAVQGWMVVVLVAREFIVSGIRGFSESQGLAFPATPAGKAKMLVQSVAICTVLYQLAFVPSAWAVLLKIALVWLTVIATVVSGLTYVGRARRLLAEATRA